MGAEYTCMSAVSLPSAAITAVGSSVQLLIDNIRGRNLFDQLDFVCTRSLGLAWCVKALT